MWKLQTKEEDALIYVNENTGEFVRCGKIFHHDELGSFYAFDNLMQMPYQRKFVFDMAQTMERIGMEKKELLERINKILTLCKDKEKGWELDVYSTAQHIEATIKDGWDYQKTALLVASVVVLQEGENIGLFDQSSSERKILQWSKVPEMLGFFLSIVEVKCRTWIRN
jgi:hypothetical protein